MPQRSLALIMVGILIWGLLLFFGAYHFHAQFWRGAILAGSAVLFLQVWLAAMLWRGAHPKRAAVRSTDSLAETDQRDGR